MRPQLLLSIIFTFIFIAFGVLIDTLWLHIRSIPHPLSATPRAQSSDNTGIASVATSSVQSTSPLLTSTSLSYTSTTTGLIIKDNNIYLRGHTLVHNLPSLLGFPSSTNGQRSGLDYVGSADKYSDIRISQEKDQFAFIHKRLSKSSRNTSHSDVLLETYAVFSADGRLLSRLPLDPHRIFENILYLDHTRAYLSERRSQERAYAGMEGIEKLTLNDVYVLEHSRLTRIARDIPDGNLLSSYYSPDRHFFAYNPFLYDAVNKSTPGVDGCGAGPPDTMSEVRLLDFTRAEDVVVVRDFTKGFKPSFWSASSSQLYIIEGHGIPAQEPDTPPCYAGDENFLVYTIPTRTIQENPIKEEFVKKLKKLCSEGHIVYTGGVACDQIGA